MTARLISKQNIVDALNEVFNIEELLKNHYRFYYEANRSDADLLHICQKYLGKKINVLTHETPWDGGSILAFCITYDDYYDICLLDKMNYCHNKFALCKELFHTIISNPEFQSIDVSNTINTCITGGSLTGAASSEFLAEIAAMEYLFPYTKRLHYVSSGDLIDYDEIAYTHRIPRLLIEKYLTKPRMDGLSSCYTESSYKLAA